MSVEMEDGPRRHRITVEEYYRMAEVGLLAPDARVELIDGEIFDMPPIGPMHASIVDQMCKLLWRAAGDRAIVRCQGPVWLSQDSELVPDIAVLAPHEGYKRRHPTAGETLLAIEVSDSTFLYDRNVKLPLYARHGIREYWIMEVSYGRLHIFRNSDGATYRDSQTLEPPGIVPIPGLEGVTIDLSTLKA